VTLPKLYAIIDVRCFSDFSIEAFAHDLSAAGVGLIQYRNKSGNTAEMLRHCRELRRHFPKSRLIMNGRADLCVAAGMDGVHLGQDDLSPEGARRVVGKGLWVGISTHSLEQVRQADRNSVDYIAIGPVFTTRSKANPDPAIGLEGIQSARLITRKPLVAIGGITRKNCCSVIAAGADSVAVISDLLDTPRQSAEEFLRLMR